MALFDRRRSPASGVVCALTLSLGIAGFGTAAAAADIDVILDQARLVKMPDRVATLIIGNPLIADAAVQSGGMMVLTGKSYGVTNIIALDRTGAVLMEKSIEVRGPRNVVVVYRADQRETFNCTPKCERQITLGDAIPVFDALIGQSTSRSGAAQGAAPAAK